MNYSEFNKGIIFAATGSLWWGVLGVIYFEYISFVGNIETKLKKAILIFNKNQLSGFCLTLEAFRRMVV